MAVSLFRPVDVEVVFDERSYGLGDSIGVKVKLSARRDVEVREARLDLVCEEEFAESYTVSVPSGPPTDYGSPWGQFGVYRAPKVPKKVDRDAKESYVHSSALFLENAALGSGSVQQFSFDMHIGTEPPPRASVGKSRWWLEAVLDLARARDVRMRQSVKVVVPAVRRQQLQG
ncbi:MAG: hypothetical protein OYI31_08500 [Chloroflexota bacterium]|nr:hypothetical protein [Chloroflexota bacterium]MDE2941745.1 hypothetical protein [Chloroflexota bacterium]MDE3268470.1 hypothetical protein [Chloroflexota bacterium]